jgi:hypothetical protein
LIFTAKKTSEYKQHTHKATQTTCIFFIELYCFAPHHYINHTPIQTHQCTPCSNFEDIFFEDIFFEDIFFEDIFFEDIFFEDIFVRYSRKNAIFFLEICVRMYSVISANQKNFQPKKLIFDPYRVTDAREEPKTWIFWDFPRFVFFNPLFFFRLPKMYKLDQVSAQIGQGAPQNQSPVLAMASSKGK